MKFRAHKPTEKRGHRFHSEALQMRELTRQATPGVLPVLDIDAGTEPAWYVMPHARMLADVVSEAETLQQIAGHILLVAETLTALADRGVYHRDIKPDNLFWYDGGPVLADFGIAYWDEAGQTAEGEKLGPTWFMAPEMRSMAKGETGQHADVYSLAQTFAVFLQGGAMPLPGTFRAGADDYHLNDHWNGHTDPLSSLSHLLEAATRNRPQDRISIGEFAHELTAWLADNQDPITRSHGFRRGWGPMDDHERDREETRRLMVRAAAVLADVVGDRDYGREHSPYDKPDTFYLLGPQEWPENSPDGFESDGHLAFSITHRSRDRRILLYAALWGNEVAFVAETQRSAADGWELEQHWPLTPWARTRLPSAAQNLRTLTEQVKLAQL